MTLPPSPPPSPAAPVAPAGPGGDPADGAGATRLTGRARSLAHTLPSRVRRRVDGERWRRYRTAPVARKRNVLRVWWWRGHPNFGDEMSALLVARAFGARVVWAPLDRCDVLAVGSILGELPTRRSREPVAVWGSGFLSPKQPGAPVPGAHYLAVRGALTLDKLGPDLTGSAAPALGDPALLTADLIPPAPGRRRGIALVPHYKHQAAVTERGLAAGAGVQVVNVLDPPQTVIDQIARSEFVISSSLHGLIVADALGIPNARMPFGRLAGGGFKFDDYHSVFDEESLTLDPDQPWDAIEAQCRRHAETYRRANLPAVRAALLRAAQGSDLATASRSAGSAP